MLTRCKNGMKIKRETTTTNNLRGIVAYQDIVRKGTTMENRLWIHKKTTTKHERSHFWGNWNVRINLLKSLKGSMTYMYSCSSIEASTRALVAETNKRLQRQCVLSAL